MKHRTYLHEEMRRDLLSVYREVYWNGNFKSQKEVYESVVRHPAPRYYICVRWAHQRLSKMMRGDHSGLSKMSDLHREMYESLYDTVVRLSQKEKFVGASLYYILRHAVKEPAPRFYISAARMGQIWRERKRLKVRKTFIHE